MKRNKLLARALPFAATALLFIVCLALPLLFLNGEGEPGPKTERALTLGRRAEIYARFAADEGLNMERLDEAEVGNDEYISCINTANAIIDTLVMDEGETRLENPFGTNFYTLTDGGDSIRIMEYYYEWTGDWHNWFTMHIDLDTGLVYYLYYSANVQQNGGLYIGRAEEHLDAAGEELISALGYEPLGLEHESGDLYRLTLAEGEGRLEYDAICGIYEDAAPSLLIDLRITLASVTGA